MIVVNVHVGSVPSFTPHLYPSVYPCRSPQIKDAGGANALATGSGNSAAKIEVSEKLVALERLNPTPRPTT